MSFLRGNTPPAARRFPGLACAVRTAAWALILFLCAGPAPAEPAAEPVLGVMTHFAQGWEPELAGRVAEAGIRSVRDELYWQEVEPLRGHYVFPGLYQRYMAELRRRGISPLIELTFANKNYDGGMTPYTEEGFQGYARYGVALLRHYGTQIGAVELWNEYNGTFCSGPALADRAATYTRMIRVAYRALKAERPDIIVAGGATAGVPLPYFEHLFAQGALDSMDAVSVHPYRYSSVPEGLEEDMAALQELIRRYNHGAPKPIWVTEIGWGTKTAAVPQGLAIDENTQASFLVRAYALLLSAGVKRIYWYLFRDTDAFASMGLVHNDRPRTPKPAYRAMKVMIDEIGIANLVRRETTAADFYSILFRRASGQEVRVMWSLQPRAIVVPASSKVVGMLGKARVSGAGFVIASEPVFVEGTVSGLPPREVGAPKIIADSVRDFSNVQGRRGWSYGMFEPGPAGFKPLTGFRETDWKREWNARYPFLSLTDREQHPAESGAGPVAAVRRWTSLNGGRLRVRAVFACGPQGDGVGVKVILEGRELFSDAIGGRRPASCQFDSTCAVPPGGRVDFAVYPATRGNADFDATQVSVTITEEP